MIDGILPDGVIAVQTRIDPDVVLFPVEEAEVGRAVDKRRREFATARGCAREAFAQLGLPPTPLVNGPSGEPLWPPELVGSITHCEGYRGVAVAHAKEWATIGIDAEPHRALPDGILATVSSAEERQRLNELRREVPHTHWDRLLFSAKESVYKAWFPLARRSLDFCDAHVTVSAAMGTFRARLLVDGPIIEERRLTGFAGRWLIRDGLVLTAIALPTGSGRNSL